MFNQLVDSRTERDQRPPDIAIMYDPRTVRGARQTVRRLQALIARRLPFSEWKRLRRPTPKEIELALALYRLPEEEIARLVEAFGPEVAE